MLIIYVPKAQAIDKTLAMLAQIRVERPDIPIVSLINLEAKNQLNSAWSLLRMLAQLSDALCVVNNSHLASEAKDAAEATGCTLIEIPALTAAPTDTDGGEVLARCLTGTEQVAGLQPCLLLPRTGDSTGLANPLLKAARKGSVPTIAYFKSLHDQGLGLSADRTGPATSPASRMRDPKSFTSFADAWIDLFLAFNDDHKALLTHKGFGADRIAVAGYPLLYPAWKALASKEAKAEFGESRPIIVFTRGETPGRPPEENIIDNEMLRRLLGDIVTNVAEAMPGAPIYIKPHPIQDTRVIEDVLTSGAGPGFDRVEIRHDAPSILCARSRLSVATYSSTIVDALAFGVPSIEYFEETEFFRKKHPGGSAFGALGAVAVRDSDSFVAAVRSARDGSGRQPNIAKALNHHTDLTPLYAVLTRSAAHGEAQ